ncbi:MAG: VanZ family protein [Oscillospiraceae bacterium]|nr:VanZ family protein [Oscillospiraceae bacterium]
MKANHPVRRIVFGLYCLLMLYLLFFQHRIPLLSEDTYLLTLQRNLNYIPGDTILRFYRLLRYYPGYRRAAIVNLFGNIVMFVPLGFGLPWVHAALRRFWKTLCVSALVIVCVELTQLVTLLGHCDVDDLILNLIGVAVGYALWAITLKRKEEPTP